MREALTELLDFEWLNRNLHQGAYTRQQSFFDQSELASTGRPADERELKLLAPFMADIRPDILAGTWRPPRSDGSGRDRQRMQAALALLREAGYRVAEGRVVDPAGAPLTLQLLALSKEQERVGLAFADALKPLGIGLSVRFVDSSLYWRRLRTFDFDTMIWTYSVSASPGTEQPNRFSSAAAAREASLNYAGVRSPAVDAMLDALRKATSRRSSSRRCGRSTGRFSRPLRAAPLLCAGALDGATGARQAPERAPRFDLNFETWWRE